MKKLLCLLMTLLCLAPAALSEEKTEQKAERVIDPTKPMIALTFDDGPSEYTQRILDTLEKYGCHATFCMVGNRMGQNAEAVAAVVASGNDIATHTWSHENLKELSSARAKRALTNGIDKITEMTGREVHFVRPPYGAWNSNVCGVCRDLGLSIVTWSIDTLDWKTRDAEKTFQTIKQQVKNGEIQPEDITEETIGAHLYTAHMPDPDLIIRPSGEIRTSNFLLWQSAYSEYYFTDVLWPDFKTSDLDAAIDNFNSRNRRFGGV